MFCGTHLREIPQKCSKISLLYMSLKFTDVRLQLHLGAGKYRADSRLALSQWQTSLQSNAASHWLGANLESALWVYLQDVAVHWDCGRSAGMRRWSWEGTRQQVRVPDPSEARCSEGRCPGAPGVWPRMCRGLQEIKRTFLIGPSETWQ